MIYLASPFFNDKQLEVVKNIERLLSAMNREFYSPRMDGVLIHMSKEERKKQGKRLYDLNIKNIINCTLLLAVIDDWDTGVVFELGFAAGLRDRRGGNIPTIVTFTNHDD